MASCVAVRGAGDIAEDIVLGAWERKVFLLLMGIGICA